MILIRFYEAHFRATDVPHIPRLLAHLGMASLPWGHRVESLLSNTLLPWRSLPSVMLWLK